MKAKTPTNEPNTITKKAILVGLILVAVNAYWVGIASELWYAVYTLVSPFSNAVFTLFVLLLVNALLKRGAPRLAFTPAELLLVYIMVTMVSTISGHAMMAILMGTMAHPFWFASPENEWEQLFLHHVPSWLTVHESQWLQGYYEGESSIFLIEHIRIWLVPVLVWSGFIFVLYGSLLCIGLLLRKQWIEHEKLSFPLTQLPLQMTTNRSFFRLRPLWIGFSLAAAIRLLAGLHDLFPVVPAFPPNYRLDRHFTERPWNAIGYTSMSFNLAIVGLTYFMPLDLSFSTWFFFWLTRAERVFARMVGWQNLHFNDRASGAWIGIAILAVWTGRRHIASFFRHVIGRARGEDADEPLSYRTVAVLLMLSVGTVFAFCYAAGMSLWVIAAFYTLFLAFALAIGRVRAELGPPYHEVIGINPRAMMVDIFGTRRLGGANLTIMTFLYAFNRCNRSHTMPNQIESLRIGERAGMPGKMLLIGMALGIGVGAIATFWSYLHVAYHYGTLARCRGAVGRFGWESFNPLQNWLQHPKGIEGTGVIFMLGGLLFVFFLHFMRSFLLWWPLHASGYVLSGASWGGLIYFWFPVMVSWLAKYLILKFSGWHTYRRMVPFFLGLVLGDYIPRSILSIVSLVLNVYMPSSGAGHTL
jgi:hypothetical protein